MEQKTAATLVSQNLKNIFAFCMARLYDKDSAEDLTNDIVCEILKSAHRIKNDDAFYAFMWRVAENTFKKHIRKKREAVSYDETHMGHYWDSGIQDMIEQENIFLLRRELSLLSKQYRETTVAYYIHGKSCSEIAREFKISVEMVKYYLFKTRKTLKEGLGMTRELGEKSYDPGIFRMDYWGGGDNSCFWDLFKRKLPGNIILSAYYSPVSIQELSVELGVALPYLEDEIDILIRHEMLLKIGSKYQTNIIIFTNQCEKEISANAKPECEKTAKAVQSALTDVFSKLKALSFWGNHYSDNRLHWAFTNLTMVNALKISDTAQQQRFGPYPPLANGSYGFVFGYDNDYQNHHFNGIYGHCENDEKNAYFSVENYRIIEKCQHYKPICREKSIKAMTDAILEKEADTENDILFSLIEEGFIESKDGKLSAAFPVFDSELMDGELFRLLNPIARQVSECMEKVCTAAAKILREHAPKELRSKCEQLAFIHYQMDVMAWIVEAMVANGYLQVSDSSEKYCVFGVRR